MKNLAFLLILFSCVSVAQIVTGDSLMAVGDYSAAIKAYGDSPETADRYFKLARVETVLGDNNAAIFCVGLVF